MKINKGGVKINEEGVKESKNEIKVNEKRNKNGIKVNETENRRETKSKEKSTILMEESTTLNEKIRGLKEKSTLSNLKEKSKRQNEKSTRSNEKGNKAGQDFEEDPKFEMLKRVVTESTGFNCEHYKESHFRRRVNVRVRATSSENYEEYLKVLKKDATEHEYLVNVLTINVSEFFRNPETFGVIEKEVIPDLIKSRSDSLIKSIRIWSAGCATGEEAYSIAILLRKILGKDLDMYRISILGTDIDNLSLEKARKGIYRENVLKNVDINIIKSYFVKQGEVYQVSEQLRNMVRFKRHDMLSESISESGTNRFDLIICRNVMIYFKKEIQEQLQLNFHQALNRGGFFVIGKAETLLGTASNRFKPYNARERLYIKETYNV